MADPLTHATLSQLTEAHRSGAMLFGSDEHNAFVELAILHVPELVAIAREHLPGETLAEIHIPNFLPRVTLNSRGHWATKARRIAKENDVVAIALLAGARKLRGKGALVGRVVITRHSVRLIDSDNATTSCKGVRDSVAKFLAVNDGDIRIEWVVKQEKVKRGGQGVVVRIEGVTNERRE